MGIAEILVKMCDRERRGKKVLVNKTCTSNFTSSQKLEILVKSCTHY